MKKEALFLLFFCFIFFNINFILAATNDLNNDANVTRADITLLILAYRTNNATFDQNGDGVINLFDLVIISKNVSNGTVVGGGEPSPQVYETFDSGDFSYTENGFQWLPSYGGAGNDSYRFVTNADPYPGRNYHLRLRWDDLGNGNPIRSTTPFQFAPNASSGYDEWAMEVYFRINRAHVTDANPGDNNKILSVYIAGQALGLPSFPSFPLTGFNFVDPSTTPVAGYAENFWVYGGGRENSHSFTQSVSRQAGLPTANTWYRVRFYNKLADWPTQNGIYKAWVDSTQLYNYTSTNQHGNGSEWFSFGYFGGAWNDQPSAPNQPYYLDIAEMKMWYGSEMPSWVNG